MEENTNKKNKKVDWMDIRATVVAVFLATIIQNYIFNRGVLEYSFWKGLGIYIIVALPVYYLMLLVQRKKNEKSAS